MADLVELTRRLAPREGLQRLSAPRLAVNRRSQPAPARRLELRAQFAIILQGEKRIHTARESYSFTPASVLVTSATTPSMSRVVRASPKQPYLSVMLDLDPAIVTQIVPVRAAPSPRSLTTLTVGSAAVIALVGDLLYAQRDAVRAAQCERELIAWVADSEHGATLRAIAARAHPDDLVQAALNELDERAGQRISIAWLAAHLGASVSTLHHRFKAHTGTSPLQHHKRLRLERARELMQLFALTAERAARDVGYASPAQFNRDYRRQFGLPPRRDQTPAG